MGSITSLSPLKLRDFFPAPYSFEPDNVDDGDLVGAGLWNVGNSCYLNAVLQCIIHTVPMLESLPSLDQIHSCASSRFCSLCALTSLVNQSLSSSGSAVSPFAFVANLREISVDFQPRQQEDAHEFLHSLLDHLHSCCLDPGSKDKPLSVSMNEYSLVKHVYGGRLISQLRCSDCGHCSDSFEPLLDLSLEIADADTIEGALESFTRPEDIEEAKFDCQGCKARVSMAKQIKVHQAPAVLSIHLKRFRNHGSSIQKIHKFVEYPLDLELDPYILCPEDDEQTMYDLYAVLVHSGGDSSGHYYCYVRSTAKTWHLMDDDEVSTVEETYVLRENAYILFYIKKGLSPWFSTSALSLLRGFSSSLMPSDLTALVSTKKKPSTKKGRGDRIRVSR